MFKFLKQKLNLEPRRYLLGKQPQKFFQDNMWPTVEEQVEKLELTFNYTFEIFKVFVAMDADASGSIDIEECFSYFGGPRNTFTERFFWLIDDNDPHKQSKPMNFLEFTLNAYKYLSLSIEQLAQMVFEIYDPDENGYVHRCEVESINRFVHSVNEHEEYYIAKFKFNENNEISKVDFIKHCAYYRYLIQPAIDYQRKIRKKLGGVGMWESVEAYRRKHFDVYDKESNNLDEAFTAIINSEDVHRRRRKMEADALLKLEQEKILAQAEEAERALQEREKKLEEEKKRMISTAPDRFMKKAWEVFERSKVEFENELYSVDQVMERREARLNLYKLLDNAIEIGSSYYLGAEENEVKLTIGTDADHVARYKDWLKSADGKVTARRTSLHIAVTNFMAKLNDEKKKAKLFRSKKKSEKEVAALTIIDEVEKELRKIEQIKNGDMELKRRYKPKQFAEEISVACKLCGKEAYAAAEAEAADRLCKELKETTITGMYSSLDHKREERRRDLVRKEFELASTFGARDTRYEYVWDQPNDKMVYVNVDTMQILHAKTAICEKCDAMIEQSELRCGDCGTGRSAKNLRLYRPLGFKDIRVD